MNFVPVAPGRRPDCVELYRRAGVRKVRAANKRAIVRLE